MADILRPNPSDFAVPSETTTGIVTRQEKGRKHGRIARAGAALVGTLMLATACAPKAETKAPTIETTSAEPVATATQTPEVTPSPSPSPTETANIESGEYIPETAYALDEMNEEIEKLTEKQINEMSPEERAEYIYALYVQATKQEDGLAGAGFSPTHNTFREGDEAENPIFKSWNNMSDKERGAAISMLEATAMLELDDKDVDLQRGGNISPTRMENMLRLLYTNGESSSQEKYLENMVDMFNEMLQKGEAGYKNDGDYDDKYKDRHESFRLGREIVGEGEYEPYPNFLATMDVPKFDQNGNKIGVETTGLVVALIPVSKGTSFQGLSPFVKFHMEEHPEILVDHPDANKPVFDEKTGQPVYKIGEDKDKQVFVPIIVEMGRHLLE